MPEEEATDIDLVVYGLSHSALWDMRAEMLWPEELGGKAVDLVRAESQGPIMIFASKGLTIYEREPEQRIEAISS